MKSNEKSEISDIWSFLDGFQLEIWLLICFTPLFLGLFSLLLERRSSLIKGSNNLNKLREILWQAFASVFFKIEMQINHFSERILFLIFWFIIFILGTLYISTIVIKLNMDKSKN